MESTERGKFEEQWLDAFADATSSPPESAWVALDASLTRLESEKMKKRVVFYKWLAAASVLVAMALAGTNYWYWRNTSSDHLAVDNRVNKENQAKVHEPATGLAPHELLKSNAANSQSSQNQDENKESQSGQRESVGNKHSEINQNSKDRSSYASTDNEEPFTATAEMKAQSLVTPPNQKLVAYKRSDFLVADLDRAREMPEPEAHIKGRPYEVTLFRILPAIPGVFMNNSRKEENRRENLWASVNASTGSYSPGSTTAPSQSLNPMAYASLSNSNPTTSRASTGSSYGVGMTVGKKIVNKLVVFGGVNYLNNAINYGSNITTYNSANKSSAFVADYASSSSTSVATTSSAYTINSVSEFVSIPVQAGYVIVERKFGVQLNTGVATDFFLRNTLTDQSGTYSRYSQAAGGSSPYRTVNWAGLLGTEMSYKLMRHYRLSLVPGMRYALNPMLKSESSTTGNAFTWDIGFRFRYIFH